MHMKAGYFPFSLITSIIEHIGLTGCNEKFSNRTDSVISYLAHVDEKHAEKSVLRAGSNPCAPIPKKELPPLRVTDAYRSVPLLIRGSAMSDERRSRLGPWVSVGLERMMFAISLNV